MDKKTGKPDKSKGKPRFMRQGDSVVCRLECVSPVCVESFKENPTMGRFSLRDEGKTIAVGKILKLVSLEKSQAEAKAAAAAAIAD
jgi:peptide chain release factor subunit 3